MIIDYKSVFDNIFKYNLSDIVAIYGIIKLYCNQDIGSFQTVRKVLFLLLGKDYAGPTGPLPYELINDIKKRCKDDNKIALVNTYDNNKNNTFYFSKKLYNDPDFQFIKNVLLDMRYEEIK
jgi:hypothetical protein